MVVGAYGAHSLPSVHGDVGKARDQLVDWVIANAPGDEQHRHHVWQLCTMALPWALNGFPRIVLGHKLAASFAATALPADQIDARMPWSTFAITLPHGLFNDGATTVSFVVVSEVGASGLHGLCVGQSSRGKVVFSEFGADSLGSTLEVSPDALPLHLVTARVLVSTVLALDDNTMHVTLAAAQRKAQRFGPPSQFVFTLTRDTKVDCQDWVRRYLGGQGISPTVQCLVRGHHKRQACGPGHAERRWIRIEPYWRGPEDAPIAVRNHLLNEVRHA